MFLALPSDPSPRRGDIQGDLSPTSYPVAVSLRAESLPRTLGQGMEWNPRSFWLILAGPGLVWFCFCLFLALVNVLLLFHSWEWIFACTISLAYVHGNFPAGCQAVSHCIPLGTAIPRIRDWAVLQPWQALAACWGQGGRAVPSWEPRAGLGEHLEQQLSCSQAQGPLVSLRSLDSLCSGILEEF